MPRRTTQLADLRRSVETASGSLRDIARRLDEISHRLPKDGDPDPAELAFLSGRIRAACECLVAEARSGNLASTGWTSRVAATGLSASISAVSVFGGAFLGAAGEYSFGQLVDAQHLASSQLQDVRSQVAELGSQELETRYDNMLAELEGFASGFETTQGRPIFPAIAAIADKTVTTEEKVRRIDSAVDMMEDWLANHATPDLGDDVYPSGGEALVSEVIAHVEQELAEVNAVSEFVSQEDQNLKGEYQGLTYGGGGTYSRSTYGGPRN